MQKENSTLGFWVLVSDFKDSEMQRAWDFDRVFAGNFDAGRKPRMFGAFAAVVKSFNIKRVLRVFMQ
ncbi:hypothetical protein [Helicobacter mustelae]|uniref:hypothetical protein n=1 Tax=Helicobacter mustelae TaxID=217 RepID=UPI0002F72CC9|nr:hypothetical protein [Helicobacter mustelae]